MPEEPDNGDGNVFESPDDPGVTITAAGIRSTIDDGSDPRIAVEEEAATAERLARDAGGNVVESDYYGLSEETAVDGQVTRAQIPGWRLIIQTTPAELGEQISSVDVLTRWRGRSVHIVCSAPTERFAAYRDLCNEVVGTLTLDGAWRP